MRYDNFSTQELYALRNNLVLNNQDTSELNFLIDCRESEYYFSIMEDTSATGGPAGSVGASVGGGGVAYANAAYGGAGAVTSAQPSIHAGATLDPSFSAGGGKEGSGDVGFPYNAAPKGVFQKVKVDNRKGNSKRRSGKLIAGFKQAIANKQDFTAGQGQAKPKRLLSFDTFSKEELNKVTRVSQ